MPYTPLELTRKELADPFRFSLDRQMGDGNTQVFKLTHGRLQDGTYQVFIDNALKVLATDYTIDIETGVVTFIVPPALDTTVEARYYFAAFSDTELTNFLELEGGNVLRAVLRCVNILLMDASRRFDYASGQTEVKASQIQDHLHKIRTVLKERLSEPSGGSRLVSRVSPAYESEVVSRVDLSRDDLGIEEYE